jgi:hypothetical protein
MKTYEDIFRKLRDAVGDQFHFYMDETFEMGIFVLPFKDSLGDNFVIRLRESDGYYILDDGGITKNALFIMSETIGGVKSGKLVSDLAKSFNGHFNRAEGLVQLASGYAEIIPKLLHFTKLLVTLDTMLVEIAREERELEKPQRRSLGPRASQRIRKSLNPLIKVSKVSHRFTVDGLTVPDWMVDLAYEPKLEPIAQCVELAVLITVDLAVLDPVLKATYAFSRAVDIKSAHAKYDIKIAYDRHGQNSASLNAANFLTQHQLDNKAYTTIDISKATEFGQLVNLINRETGMPLTV